MKRNDSIIILINTLWFELIFSQKTPPRTPKRNQNLNNNSVSKFIKLLLISFLQAIIIEL